MRYSLPAVSCLFLFTIVTIGTTNRIPAQYPGPLTVVHKTGDPIIDPNPTGAGNTGQIIDLGQGPSINDASKVAFIARDTAGSFGRVLLVTPSGVFDRNFPITSLQVIGEELEVNNKDQICWQDQVLTNGDTFVRRLDNNAGGVAIAIGSTFFTTPFLSVSPYGVSIDDTGRVMFTGTLLNGGTVLASRSGGSGAHNITPAVSGSPSYYPMIANDGATVVRYGSSTTSPLRRYSDPSLATFTTIAAPPTFQAIAGKPGISDDGSFTSFLAVHSTLGTAVYGHLAGGPSLITIADTTATSPISSISSLKRISVNRVPSRNGTIYRTAYAAQSTSNVIGLYTSDVDVSLNPAVVGVPNRIVQVGDSVRGLTGAVTDIDMYDALNTKGEIVFWVKTSSNQQAIVRGTVTSIEIADGASVGVNGFLYVENGRITGDWQRLVVPGEERTGVTADGVARVVIRIRTASKGTVSVGFKTASSGSGAMALPGGTFGQQPLQIPTRLINGDEVAIFVYRAPADFVRTENQGQDKQSAERKLVLSYSFSPEGSSSKFLFEDSLVIHRPPVVFCHGLWSSRNTWKDETSNRGFGTLASGQDKRFPSTVMVDYRATAGDSFAWNARFVTHYINRIVNKVRAERIACAQVDWVGHSMGAVLPRYEYRLSTVNRTARPWNRPDNFEAGDIHKIILLNSPQWGSPLANVVFPLKQSAFFRTIMGAINKPLNGAIADLREGSDAYLFISETPFHAHAIVSTGLEKTLGASPIGFRVASTLVPPPGKNILFALGIVATITIDLVYRGEQHDLVVLAPSQGAGLPAANASPPLVDLLKTVHWDVTSWDTAANRVIELLDAPMSQFSPNMPKPNPNPKGGFAFAERLVEPVFDGVEIRSPSGAKFVEPGKTIVLEVVGKNNFVPVKVSVPTYWDFQETSTNPFRVTLTVPKEASGELSFMALGEDAAQKFAYSQLFTLPVKISANLTAISTPLSDALLFEPNQTMQLFVEGGFDDNVTRDVTKAISGSKYTSSSPSVASVTADGLITVLKEGQTKITITNTATSMSPVVSLTVEYGPVRIYGQGTAGSGAISPQLHTGGQQPKIGNTSFKIQVDMVLGGATGLLLIAPKPSDLPLFGGRLLVDPILNVVIPVVANGSVGVPGGGAITLPFRIPNNKNLVGASSYLQAGFSDKGAVQGVSLTNGLFLRVIE